MLQLVRMTGMTNMKYVNFFMTFQIFGFLLYEIQNLCQNHHNQHKSNLLMHLLKQRQSLSGRDFRCF